MNCWHCGTELIWGADFDMEDINDGEESDYDFWSSFTCPKCQSYVEALIDNTRPRGIYEPIVPPPTGDFRDYNEPGLTWGDIDPDDYIIWLETD